MSLSALLSLASCSNDNFDEPSQGTENGDVAAYISVNIAMNDNGTRADNLGTVGQDFQYGTAEENAVKTLLLGFYNASGNFLELVNVTPDGTPNASGQNVAVNVPVSAKVTSSTAPESTASVQIVAYINVPKADLEGKTLQQAQDALLSSYNPYNGFAMTNSGYYTGNNFTTAVTATGDKFYKVGERPEGYQPITIYVERVAAKIELKEIKTIEPYLCYTLEEDNKLGKKVNLTFTPTNWDIQAVSQRSYMVKHAVASKLDWDVDASSYFRSYWAKSYGYDLTQTPIIGTDFLKSGQSDVVAEGGPYLLSYKKYPEILANGQAITWNGEKSFGNPVYALENTYAKSRLYNTTNDTYMTDYNPWSAVTSIVLAGTYTATAHEDNSTLNLDDFEDDFYLREKSVIDTDQTAKVVMQILTAAQAKSVMLGEAGFITTKDAQNNHHAITADDVEFTYVAGQNSSNPANARFLKLATGKEATDYYIYGVQATSLEDVNNALATIAPARYYAQKQAFFYIPLRHYDTETDDQKSKLNMRDLKEVVEGNYGIVRNNWYELTVNKIAGLGTGIGDPDGPGDTPIPDPKEDKYQIDATIKVLQWHMRRQTVDL